MSKDDIYNKLCEVFYNEESRLMNKIENLEYLARYRLNDKYILVELIETRAILNYFRTYIMDVLNFLKLFDR